jgi:hypothetical protein
MLLLLKIGEIGNLIQITIIYAKMVITLVSQNLASFEPTIFYSDVGDNDNPLLLRQGCQILI